MMGNVFDIIVASESGHPALDRWDSIINQVAPQYQVPPNLVKAHMLYESGGDSRIISGDLGYGLMQITSGVVDGLYNGANILDPFTNIKVACRDFIAPAMRTFPTNLKAVIASYNAGIGAVQAALHRGESPESVTYAAWYVPRITDAFAWFNSESHRDTA